MIYESSFPNNNNNNQIIIQNNQISNNQNQIQTPDRIKKKVNFNNKVDVVKIESYKKYNKLEDEYFKQMFLNSYAIATTNNTQPKNKTDCDCSCIIM